MSDRSTLIKRASALPVGNTERREILSALKKTSRMKKLTIYLDRKDRDDQPYVIISSGSGAEEYFYQVRPNEWRNGTGIILIPELAGVAEMMLKGRIG